MLKAIQLNRLLERVETDAKLFQEAYPFRHIVIDDLLAAEVGNRLVESFPSESWDCWHRNQNVQDRFQPLKMTCDRPDRIPEPLDRLIFELNSGPFLSWLEKLTGIGNLLPDPHLFGGGLHYSGPGGMLKPHIDFHYGKNPKLHRRLNLLVYLNANWSPSYNGALELWDQERDCIAREVYPECGRVVLFQTDAVSLHGFSKPLVERSRHSIALYYYSVEAPAGYSGDYATHWRKEANRSPQSRMGRFRRRSFGFCARVLSAVAWRLNSVANKVESLSGKEFA